LYPTRLPNKMTEVGNIGSGGRRNTISYSVEGTSEVYLEVLWQHRVGDWPRDYGEMFGPSTRWFRTAILAVKAAEPGSDLAAASHGSPIRCPRLKRLPVFVAIVAVAQFGRVDDPQQPVCAQRLAAGEPLLEVGCRRTKLRGFQVVFKREDWPSVRPQSGKRLEVSV
jgi:hypothetical protein